MSDFVTIATYDDYLSANRDLDRLEENGITCYLADENTIMMYWLYKNALGESNLELLEKTRKEPKPF